MKLVLTEEIVSEDRSIITGERSFQMLVRGERISIIGIKGVLNFHIVINPNSMVIMDNVAQVAQLINEIGATLHIYPLILT